MEKYRTDSLKKKNYLLILFILSFSFLSNTYLSFILTNDVLFVITLLFIIGGWFYYTPIKSNYFSEKKKYFYWVFFLITLSTLVPFYFYNQSVFWGIVAQRTQYLFVFFGLLLLRIRPSNDDFIYVFKNTAYLSLICFVISILAPNFFLDEAVLKEEITTRRIEESTDIGFITPGVQLAALYLFYCIQRFFNRPTKMEFFEACLFMGYIILYQNRSTIIGTFPIFCVGILFMRSKYKSFFIGVLIILLLVSFPLFFKLYNSLINETQSELADENYNRYQAISFYLFELKNDYIKIIFGNGLWINKGSYTEKMISAQSKRGTFVSDLGILGSYYYYGIGVIIILLIFLYNAIIKIQVPLYLKFFSLWILFVPTIHSYLLVSLNASILHSSYFYLVMLNSFYDKPKRISNNSELQYEKNYL